MPWTRDLAFMKVRRNTIARNLRIVGAVGAEGSESAARESFIRTVANLMCSSVSANMRGEDIGEVLEVENPELLAEAAAQGKGVLLLLAHMGNWELLTRLHRTLSRRRENRRFLPPAEQPHPQRASSPGTAGGWCAYVFETGQPPPCQRFPP